MKTTCLNAVNVLVLPQPKKTFYGYKVVRKACYDYNNKVPSYICLASPQSTKMNEWVEAWDMYRVKFAGFHYFIHENDAQNYYLGLREGIMSGVYKKWWLPYSKLTIVYAEFEQVIGAGIKPPNIRMVVAKRWMPLTEIPLVISCPTVSESVGGLVTIRDPITAVVTAQYWSVDKANYGYGGCIDG